MQTSAIENPSQQNRVCVFQLVFSGELFACLSLPICRHSSKMWHVFFSTRIQQDPVLHGLEALNGTLRNWTVRGGKCRPWSVELVAAGWGGTWLALTVLWKELSSMPRLELSGLSRKIFLDMKLHQLQIQIPASHLASPLPEKILFTLNMDEVTRGSISMAQLDLCPLGRFILFNWLGYKTDQPAPQTSLWPWD